MFRGLCLYLGQTSAYIVRTHPYDIRCQAVTLSSATLTTSAAASPTNREQTCELRPAKWKRETDKPSFVDLGQELCCSEVPKSNLFVGGHGQEWIALKWKLTFHRGAHSK